MRIKQVKCLSGLQGEQRKLRPTYDNSLAQFRRYCDIYGIHTRLGYSTPEAAWKAAPTIQSSVKPTDLCRVDKLGRRYQNNG